MVPGGHILLNEGNRLVDGLCGDGPSTRVAAVLIYELLVIESLHDCTASFLLLLPILVFLSQRQPEILPDAFRQLLIQVDRLFIRLQIQQHSADTL